ncbi:MAG: hypothetical protein GXP22_05975 [Gammaproteobacteria bacterium]|nr:hypothetical protein [Gammaproteobacteria bacterium]
MSQERIDAIKKAQGFAKGYANTNGGCLPHPMMVLSPMPMHVSVIAESSGIIKFIADEMQCHINVFRTRGLTDPVHAYFIKYEKDGGLDRVTIAYSAELNLCWSRLLICKEAAHVFLSTPKNATSSSGDAINLVTNLLNDAGRMQEKGPALVVEDTAYFAAIELLFPRQLVAEARHMLEYGSSYKDVAVSFKVPEQTVEYRFLPAPDALFNSAYDDYDRGASGK